MIYIPFVNRPDLLARAAGSLPPGAAQVLDASPAGLGVPEVAGQPVARLTETRFTAVQNWMQRDAYARGLARFGFLHGDAQAAPGGLALLHEKADALDAAGTRWGVVFSVYDAFCLFSAAAVRDVGPWDESFWWYVSDVDYYNRLRWAGWGHHAVPEALAAHEGSATLAALPPAERAAVARDHEWAVRHYCHKWGCHWSEGDGRRHRTPYGRP